jgi:ABC-type dipeptide/oligopeptide/nickel transport system permease subunit
VSYADPSIASELTGRARRRRLARKRFLRRPFAVIGLTVALTFVIVAIFAPVIAPYRPDAANYNEILRPSSWQHLLGTDELGRDVFSRVVWGARASIVAGVVATMLAAIIGVPIGMLAGYYRGWIDPVIARGTDVLLAFPFLILAVGLAAILGPSLRNATIALGVAAIPGLIRVARGEALSLSQEDYVRAAIANGASDARILGKHIFPNMLPTVIVQVTVTIPALIIGEAVLSFLGLGVQSPATSWGVMLSDAKDYLTTAPRLAIYPGIAIFLCSLSFNLFGDGLRDILDPRTTR